MKNVFYNAKEYEPLSSEIIIKPIRIDNHMHFILPTSLSILITFTFHIVLNEKRASSLLSQHYIENVFQHTFLSVSCVFNKRGMYR